MSTTTDPATPHYAAPDAITRHLVNPLVAWATRRGLRAWGARTLEVRGRSTGELRTTPVNVLELDGVAHLVAPRGTTEWVRNVRAAGGVCTLRSGRHVERVVATEIADDDKPAVLRAYLGRWRWEAGRLFGGVAPDATEDELRAIASRHPVFRLTPAA